MKLKQLMIAAAVSILAATPVFAQQASGSTPRTGQMSEVDCSTIASQMGVSSASTAKIDRDGKSSAEDGS